jgi:hypothetical protein
VVHAQPDVDGLPHAILFSWCTHAQSHRWRAVPAELIELAVIHRDGTFTCRSWSAARARRPLTQRTDRYPASVHKAPPTKGTMGSRVVLERLRDR